MLGRGCVFISFKAIHGILSVGQVWHIRLTIHVLSDAGNMVDCACLAGIVALKHFRRPEVEVEGDVVEVCRSEHWNERVGWNKVVDWSRRVIWVESRESARRVALLVVKLRCMFV